MNNELHKEEQLHPSAEKKHGFREDLHELQTSAWNKGAQLLRNRWSITSAWPAMVKTATGVLYLILNAAV